MQNGQGGMQELETYFNFLTSKPNFFKVLGITRKLTFK